MSTPGSRAMAAGLTVMLLSVSAGIHFGAGSFGLVLSFTGVLVGANLVAVGVLRTDDPEAPVGPVLFDGALALAAFLRRNLTVVGLVLVSFAVTAFSGEAGPVLCLSMFALLLLGLSLINIGALRE